MTVEEIRAMCDSVINTTNQMDKDYEILKNQRSEKIKEIGDEIEATLKDINSKYIDTLQSIYNKAKSIEENNKHFWYPTSEQIGAPKIRDSDFSTTNCLHLSFYDNKLIISTFTSEDGALENKKGPYNGVRLTTDGDYSECYHTDFENVYKAFESTLRYCELKNLLEIMTFTLENMEVLVQKLIAEVAKRILDYTTERNAKITDNL